MRLQPKTSRSSGPGELPLTSLIDCVFLLLIYFLVTSSLVPNERNLSSALRSQRGGAGRAADLQPQVVMVDTINGEPSYTLGSNRFSTRDALTRVLRVLPKESGVFVRATGRATVAGAAAAIQACKDAGFTRVSYVPAK